jgi:hypothetical protein
MGKGDEGRRGGITDLLLSSSSFGAHMREEGDIVHLDEPRVDVGFVREDVQSGGEELM